MDNAAIDAPAKQWEKFQQAHGKGLGLNYDPLDTVINEIRLLTLLPDDTEVVHCYLEHVSLINPPGYAALSYCWGDPELMAEIKIRGIPVLVTTNLEFALRYHRAKRYSRLWVDAICINQQDKTERNQQLLWIGSIYRRAREVAAWTGGDCDLAIDFINHLNGFTDLLLVTAAADSIGEAAFLEIPARPYW